MIDISEVESKDSEAPRILVVDDDDDVRTLVQEVLTEDGYSSVAVPNGQLALNWLRSSPVVPSLILLDLMMPQMDGWEFLVRIDREPTLRRIPVAIMSAHPSIGRQLDDPKGQFEAYFLLPKPLDVQRLLAIAAGVVPGNQRSGDKI